MFNRPRIIPTLLMDDRDLIKTIRFEKRTYLGDPVNAVKIFNRKGIDELSILDIGVTKNNKEPDFEYLKDIASEAFMPLSYGGGIKSVEQIHELLKIGYEKVVINTAFVKNSKLVSQAASFFGSQSIVVSIDAKKENADYRCYISDGTEKTSFSPIELSKRAEEFGAGELIINSVDNDGMMSGYDVELVRRVVEAVRIPVVALGGARDIHDLKDVLERGHAHAAAGGSMFVYYGRLKAVLITAPSEIELTEAGIYQK